MTREEALEKLPNGWTNLIERVFEVIEGCGCEVLNIWNKMGFLRVRYRGELTPKAYHSLALIEVESDKTCMHCGRYGKRRSCSHVITLCEDCMEMGVGIRYGKTFIV